MFRASLFFFLFHVLFPLSLWAEGTFQQRVDHRIQVRLDDQEQMLHGQERIRYINRSNTPLRCIYFHLWPEAYSHSSTPLSQQLCKQGNLSLYYASEEERGYMDSLDFRVKGKKVPFYRNSDHLEIGHILLNDPLQPKDTLMIRTSFRVKIPDAQFSRMGAKGDAFKITQWYPKPAVYDESGWQTMPYLNQGEFYNEFGSYEVSITLPANYTVGATGKLVSDNGERERLNKIARKTKELDSIPDENEHPPSSDKMKTLTYRADSVTDFAWFADKRYRVLQEWVPLPRSDRKVLARVFFTDHQGDIWEHSMDYLKEALYYYSLWVGPYPHDRISVVSSQSGVGGGMEYPGISAIGPVSNGLTLERVIAHEVGHNWFQATLATNERKHPWMDEGLNSYFENRYMRVQHPNLLPFEGSIDRRIVKALGMDGKDPMYQHYLQYQIMAAQEEDQPLSSHSRTFTQTNYGAMPYSKGAMLFAYLEEYLGQETFDRAIRSYYSQWRFKHPKPEDLEQAFTQTSEKDLSPFFEDFLHSTGEIDYSIKKVTKSGKYRFGDQYKIKVKNEGDITAPVPLTLIQADTIVQEKWITGLKEERNVKPKYFTGEVKAFALDGKKEIPDIDRRNDRYSNRSWTPRQAPIDIDLLFGIDDPKQNDLYAFPTLGWNKHDGFMSGMGIHEQGLKAEAFDFAIAPTYAWKSGRFTGIASAGWNEWWDDSPILEHFRLSAQAKRFSYRSALQRKGYYERLVPKLELWYKKGKATSPHQHRTVLEVPFIRSKVEQQKEGPGDGTIREQNLYYELTQIWERNDALVPMDAKLRGLHHKKFTRISGEWNGAFRYNDQKDALSLRLFGGKFLRSEHSDPVYNWKMNGRGPAEDFLFEQHFFERGALKGFWNQQFARQEGGFYIPTAYGSSNDWLVSASLELDIPFPDRPSLSIFFDQGWAPTPLKKGPRSLYEGGVSLKLLDDLVTVHFPIIYSDVIEKEHAINRIGAAERIRFQIRLDRLDLFERLRTHSL